MKEAFFVRYFDGKFWDGNGQQIVVTAAGGGSGDVTETVINAAAAKTTIADADKIPLTDSAASSVLKTITGFDFKAWIVAYLKTLDFVRVNASKDLLSGSDAIVTQAAAGMRYGFLAATAISDPTSGLFKSSVAVTVTLPATNSTIIIMIDNLDKNGTDQGGWMSSWVAGGTLSIRSAASTDTSFMVVSVTTVADQAPTDTYYQITGKFIGGSIFAGGESCVLQYIPPTNVGAAIDGAASKASPVDADKIGLADSAAAGALKYLSWANLKTSMSTSLLALGYARIDASGNLLSGNGSAVDGVNTIYALASAPVSGITALPLATDVTDGTVVAIHKDCLVGVGANPIGFLLKSNVALNQWRPPCDSFKLFSKTATIASPIFKMSSTTQASSNKFNVGVDPVIPGGLFYAGSKIILRAHFRRNVTAVALGAITLRAYLGKNATPTSNLIVWEGDITDADKRDMTPMAVISLTSLTAVESTRNLSPGGPGLTTGAIALTSANLDFAVNQTLTFHIVVTGTGNLNTLDANNNIDLISYSLTMEGQ